MNRQKWILLFLTLALVAGTGVSLARVKHHRKLGAPGVKSHPIPNSIRVRVDLPEKVLDYTSELLDPTEEEINTLPKDTSFGRRRYIAPDGSWILTSVVLMGTDRTSMHKPQLCLTGQGWNIDEGASSQTTIHMERPCQYELPVVKLLATKEAQVNGEVQKQRGLYVYWFVADDALSASVSGFQRMYLMGKRMLQTGVLQRWAYVSCFCSCPPGQEDATFERVKKFIAAAAPEFQLMPRPPALAASNSAPTPAP